MKRTFIMLIISLLTFSLFLFIGSMGSLQGRLSFAACAGNVASVKWLTKVVSNVDAKDSGGDTALIDAEACAGHDTSNVEEIIKILLANGANVNLQARDGRTALMYAARNGHTNIVKLLLSKGANPNLEDNDGESSLMKAATTGCSNEVIEILIAAGADVNARNSKGESVLDQAKSALMCPDSGIGQLLMNKGAK